MGKLNKEWHLNHKMPKNPTDLQRAQWHREHAQHCGCRKPGPRILALMKEQGLSLPE